MSELEDVIRDAAERPASVSSDGRSATSHRLTDLIEVDRYLRRRGLASDPRRSLLLVRLRPPGA